MSRFARTIVPPKTCPIDWWPRQTPRIGIRPANLRTALVLLSIAAAFFAGVIAKRVFVG